MEALVSVIMPVYNGAAYIRKGIQSVLGQTYRALELIIVNDGSKDNSKEIVEQIIKENPSDACRIKYIEQENQGIARARNRGLAEASGVYVAFIDHDDWMDLDHIEHLMQKAEETDADEVIGGYRLVSEQGRVETAWNLQKGCEWSKYRIVAPWSKLFKKEIIDKYHINFLDTKISEDLYFNILFMSHTEKVEIISGAGYNWLDNKRSESQTKWNKISDDRNPIIVLNALQNEIKGTSYLGENLLTYFFAKYLVWYLLYNVKRSDREKFSLMYKECFFWLDANYPRYREWKITGIHVPKGELFRNRLCVTGGILLHRMKLLLPALLCFSEGKS